LLLQVSLNGPANQFRQPSARALLKNLQPPDLLFGQEDLDSL